MISFEAAPSDQYTRLFFDLTERHKFRLAGEIMGLARVIAIAGLHRLASSPWLGQAHRSVPC